MTGTPITPPTYARNIPDPIEIILTTGLEIPDQPIAKIVNIIAAEAALGINVLRDIANNWRDFFGGRSESTQSALKQARTAALNEMRAEAARIGAHAVIGVRIEYSEVSTSGTGGGILLVAASGTAVKLKSR